MALHVVAQLKNGIQALLQNLDLSTVGDLDGALERAARVTIQQADIPEASGIQAIQLYGGVNYYPTPSTIFGSAITLIRKQGDASTPWDYNYKTTIDQFTRTKHWQPNGYMMDFEYVNGVGQIGISTPNTFPKLIIDPMNVTTGWIAGGSASGLVQDTVNYYESPAALRFNLAGASAGYIEKTLTTAINMSSYSGVGVVFLALETTSAANLTSVNLRLGSNSSNYASVTNTTGFLGAWIANNWLLVALDLATAVNTGTPNFSAIDYVRVTANTADSIPNFRVGGIWTSLATPHEILFESSAIFLDGGVPTQTITSDNNTIVLNDAAYQLYEYESALTVALQQGGSMAAGINQVIHEKLYGVRARNGAVIQMGLYDLYRANNPSGQLRQISTWYDSSDRTDYGGRGGNY